MQVQPNNTLVFDSINELTDTEITLIAVVLQHNGDRAGICIRYPLDPLTHCVIWNDHLQVYELWHYASAPEETYITTQSDTSIRSLMHTVEDISERISGAVVVWDLEVLSTT